ncbi:acyltransferase [Tamlana agarivorans]|uniref:Acyltransferase n=1 Tax=Pseudotamlana agarivorans TaxID=481183 RepID=A0ACC5UCT5_9FLAO|nr:acyltransferase [Tamlana agarivorans]MBU2952151.1 acyltransferase [Tamlana agarivorans]
MHRENNFDFLRFLFAVFVVLTHAFAISGEGEHNEWLYQWSNGQTAFSQIGLSGFFVISGYFIFQSMQRSDSLLTYYKKRFLRLFPALFVVLILTLLLLPFVYERDVPMYKNVEVLTYLPNNLSLYNFQPVIKGVFDNNPYHSINGSLWTIRYEFSLYIAVGLLYAVRHNYKMTRVLIALVFIAMLIVYNFFMARFGGSSILGMQGSHILNLGAFFVCGSLLAAYGFENINNKKLLLFVTVVILIFSLTFNFYREVKHIVFPVVILLIGFIPFPFFSRFEKIGDMSYGIYIYSFPIQQTLVYFYKLDVYQLIFWSLLISIVFGYLSWHLVEKKALIYKVKSMLNYGNLSLLKGKK